MDVDLEKGGDNPIHWEELANIKIEQNKPGDEKVILARVVINEDGSVEISDNDIDGSPLRKYAGSSEQLEGQINKLIERIIALESDIFKVRITDLKYQIPAIHGQTVVGILGENFSPDPNKNIITFFGGGGNPRVLVKFEEKINTATDRLDVLVPINAKEGIVMVEVNGQVAESEDEVEMAPPI